MKMQICTMDSF